MLYIAPFDLCHTPTFTRMFPTPTSNLLAKVKIQGIIKNPKPLALMDVPFITRHYGMKWKL